MIWLFGGSLAGWHYYRFHRWRHLWRTGDVISFVPQIYTQRQIMLSISCSSTQVSWLLFPSSSLLSDLIQILMNKDFSNERMGPYPRAVLVPFGNTTLHLGILQYTKHRSLCYLQESYIICSSIYCPFFPLSLYTPRFMPFILSCPPGGLPLFLSPC